MRRLAFILILFIAGCQAQVAQCDRPAMGFAFFPTVFMSSSAQGYVDAYQDDADLLVLHFGDSVPWSILEECPDLSCNPQLKQMMDALKAHASSFDGKVMVSANPLNNERDGIAQDWDGVTKSDPPFTTFSEGLQERYTQWISYLVSTFNPEYLVQGIEINMYAEHDDFNELLKLMKAVKEKYPSQTIGPSMQWEFLQQNHVDIEWEELGSSYVISTYPRVLDQSADVTPYDVSSFDPSRKVFIAESGIQHEKQQELLTELFAIPNVQAVVWFFKEDAKGYFDALPQTYPFTVFHNVGLVDDQGNPNQGYHFWSKKFSCE